MRNIKYCPWLRENNLKTGKSIEDAFIAEIKDVLQEALEEEITNELGYSKYDWKNKNTSNSRNGHTKKTVKSQFGEISLTNNASAGNRNLTNKQTIWSKLLEPLKALKNVP